MERNLRSRLREVVGEGTSSSKFLKRNMTSQPQANRIPELNEDVEDTELSEDWEDLEPSEDAEVDPDNEERQGDQVPNRMNQHSKEARADNVVNGKNASHSNLLLAVTLNDPEVLDCPICNVPLTIPVYQCRSGHVVCKFCYMGNTSKNCPSCRLPMDGDRNMAMEKVIESVQVKCLNAEYGCKETMGYSMIYDHNKACHFAPCLCLVAACGFVGSYSKLYQHFREMHKNLTVPFLYGKLLHFTLNVHHDHIFLQENSGCLFILNNRKQASRHEISVSCIAPSFKGGTSYYIRAKSGAIDSKFHSCTKNTRGWDDDGSGIPSVPSLCIPSDFFGSYGQLNLEIRVQRPKQ